MNHYPVTNPAPWEKTLFDAALPVIKPVGWFYDVYTETSAHREWFEELVTRPELDVHNPQHWDIKHHAQVLGEWLAQLFRDCERVLDVGCGQGYPSLYLARYLPEVVGIDVSGGQIQRAREAAEMLGLSNAAFEVGRADELRFPDASFDGVCFMASLGYPQCDPCRALEEAARVLRPGGVAAFGTFLELGASAEPEEQTWGGAAWFVDTGPPALHCWAGSEGRSRRYLVHYDSDSRQGQALLAAREADGDDQQEVSERLVEEIASGQTTAITAVHFTGEGGGPVSSDPQAFCQALTQAGFRDITSWEMPSGKDFAEALAEEGLLERLRQEDLMPYLRGLARSAPRAEGCRYEKVSCIKR